MQYWGKCYILWVINMGYFKIHIVPINIKNKEILEESNLQIKIGVSTVLSGDFITYKLI